MVSNTRFNVDDLSPEDEQFCKRYEALHLPKVANYPDGGRAANLFKNCLLQAITALECGKQHELDRVYNVEVRELLGWETGTMPFLNPVEVQQVKNAERDAILRAVPPRTPIEDCNGIDIGAGGRRQHPTVIPIEPHRTLQKGLPSAQQPISGSVLSWADNLPFADDSLDYIISNHNLEHLDNPVNTILTCKSSSQVEALELESPT